ncbi:hypothetical protein EF405_10480 [Cyclobacteriaceae bacterium YHN15]|nr:hypothetical protein EF405_10480 [Cyclobacteriaceae bacterium YHN15]
MLRTVSHLKPVQVAYQFKNRLIKPKSLRFYKKLNKTRKALKFFELPPCKSVLKYSEKRYIFNFLNLEKQFEITTDWNFQGYGKLWNYNLQYLDFLKQTNVSNELKIALIKDLYQNLWEGDLLLEPYPASLRIMNMIRFLSKSEHHGETELLETYLLAEVNYLSKNLEYHILANHLLENAFALLMGGYFFDQKEWIDRAEKLLEIEMDEQILNDGAHFELSPMYHQIILFRVLEAMAYLPKEEQLYQLLKHKAGLMLSWLATFSFKDGTIAHFNDSCDGIAFETPKLLEMGKGLGVEPKSGHILKESGYRKFEINDFELVTDVHGISPDYQPGHAHADTFSFCLNYKGKPIVVDPGISTYNISSRRDWERSTSAHNTLTINDKNSAEVWAGFRVGRRPDVSIIDENNMFIQVTHNGFSNQKINVLRKFNVNNDFIEIEDFLDFNTQIPKATIHFHFHPDVEIKQTNESLFQIGTGLKIEFIGDSEVELFEYDYCIGFNRLTKAKKITVTLFTNSIKTIIRK